MNTTQIDAFLTVADTLSFARAAEQLHVTQPAVTQQIKSLEAELGCVLFKRTTRRVSLTEEGQAFVPDAEAIMAATRRALVRYRSGSAETPVRFSVGCRSFGHSTFTAQVFAAMAADEPLLHPDLLVIPHDHLHVLLEDGSVDLVLDFAGLGHRGEKYTQLTEVPIVCVCPEDHPFVGRDAVGTDDLKDVPLAVTKPNYVPEQLREQFGTLIMERPEARQYVCDSVEAALMVVSAGLAVSVLPALSVPPQMPIVSIPFADASPAAFGAYTFGAEKAALIDRFCDLARAALGQ